MHDQPSGTAAILTDLRISPEQREEDAYLAKRHAQGDKGPQVSKSDQQLFGPLAGVVRQLGVAASAAADARTLMRERGDEAAVLVKYGSEFEQAETGEQTRDLLSLLWELEEHATRIHGHVAALAIRERRQMAGSMGSSIGSVPELTLEAIDAAIAAHPLRDIGISIAVSEDLRDTVAKLWMTAYERLQKLSAKAEVSWSWAVDEQLAMGRWDVRSKY